MISKSKNFISALSHFSLGIINASNIDNIAEFAFSHSSRLKVGESAGKDTMKKKPFSRDGLLTLVSEMSGTPNEIKVSIQTVSEESIVSWAEEIKRKMDSMDDVGF